MSTAKDEAGKFLRYFTAPSKVAQTESTRNAANYRCPLFGLSVPADTDRKYEDEVDNTQR